ncbi:MAG: hypothetical protein K2X27_15965 [Candidatus Obscuribacterales bacterium]|nr:hypothetical protein [Candidatus Obscuribacterales bacterium]
MTESIAEKVELKKRQIYLDSHLNEYPFPLNGSDWAREIREHQYLEHHPNKRCETCENLLSRLHRDDKFFRRQRTAILRALHHWFMHDVKVDYFLSEQLSAEELAKYQLLDDVVTLADAEQNWLSQKTYIQSLDDADKAKTLASKKALEAEEEKVALLERADYQKDPSVYYLQTAANEGEEKNSDWEI